MPFQEKISQKINVLVGLLGQGASKPKASLVFTVRVTSCPLHSSLLLLEEGQIFTGHWFASCPNGFTEAASSQCCGNHGRCWDNNSKVGNNDHSKSEGEAAIS